METQPFFSTIAGLSVSLAGFGGVIAWLRDDFTVWDPVTLWRVKTIVRHALTLAFISLSLGPVFSLTGDVASVVKYGSAAIIVFEIAEMYRERRREPAIWTPPFTWVIFMVGSVFYALLQLANFFLWQSMGVLQIGVILVLGSPAGIFSNFVRELGQRRSGAVVSGDVRNESD